MSDLKSSLSFLMLGTGDFFSKFYYHTSFVILLDEKPILVDCPDPLPKMLYEAYLKSGINIELDDIDNLILTHVHGDHSNGLESLGFHNYFIREETPTIHTIPEVREAIWENKLKASMGTNVNENFEMVGNMKCEDFFKTQIIKIS